MSIIKHTLFKVNVCFLFLLFSFVMRANTFPVVDSIENKTICNGSVLDSIHFTGTGTYYTWTCDNPSIGLAARGSGTIPSFTPKNTGTSPITATITVQPLAIKDSTYIYVTNNSTNTVSVISTATNKVVDTIIVGHSPVEISISPSKAFVYVSNSDSNTISVISTLTNKVINTIKVGDDPLGNTFSPNSEFAYVANAVSQTVSKISTATNLVLGNVSIVNGYPYGATIRPDGLYLYVLTEYPNFIYVINTTTDSVLNTIPLNGLPWGSVISPDGSLLYVDNSNSNSVNVINTSTNSIIKSISVGIYPSGVSINSDGSLVYVSNNGSNTVSVINTATDTVIATIPVGKEPWANIISADNSRVYVANSASNTVSVIDAFTNKVITTIPVTNPLYITKPDSVLLYGAKKTFTITVNPSQTTSVQITSTATSICPSSNVTFTANPTNGGNTPTYQWKVNNRNVGINSNTYTTDTLKNGDKVSCEMTPDVECPTSALDTSNTITIQVKSATTSTTNKTICPSALPYRWNGNSYTTAGTYTVHFTNSAGCDSSAILVLNVNQPTHSTINATICQGESYSIGDSTYTTTGTYTVHTTNVVGCDSTITLKLAVNQKKQTTINEEICSNETYTFGNSTLSQTGTYTQSLTSSAGCDSTVILNLNVKPAYTQTREISIIYGEKDTLDGKVYDEAGTYTDNYTTVNGCDSIITTTVTLVKTHCPRLIIPEFFSPNGDGVDDIWQIENLSCYSATVDIYDRYGNRVARYTGVDAGWDGTYQGHPEPSADYWYVIALKNINETKKGHFSLKR